MLSLTLLSAKICYLFLVSSCFLVATRLTFPSVKANLSASPKTQLSAEEVQAQLMTFIMAGWGTVLSVQSGFLRQLVLHPEVQRKLRAELLALGDHPSADQLHRAEYLDACLKEAIRLVDVTPLERIASQDDVIPLSEGVRLTDGTWLDALPVKKGQSLRWAHIMHC